MPAALSPDFPILNTERLRLRQMTHADAPAVQAIFGSAEVLRFLNNPPVDSPDKALALIDRLNGFYHDQHVPQWGIKLQGQPDPTRTCRTYR